MGHINWKRALELVLCKHDSISALGIAQDGKRETGVQSGLFVVAFLLLWRFYCAELVKSLAMEMNRL